MLDKIKARLNIEDNSRDFLLLDLIEDSEEELKELTNNPNLKFDRKAEGIVKELVVIKFNRLGAEGLSSESVNGHSQSFIDGLPKDLRTKILSMRKLRR
ncbi:phage head-tail connector protein [Clostridium perfringens]|nr:phage head-tail connector protein [Clostridium perfringens]